MPRIVNIAAFIKQVRIFSVNLTASKFVYSQYHFDFRCQFGCVGSLGILFFETNFTTLLTHYETNQRTVDFI